MTKPKIQETTQTRIKTETTLVILREEEMEEQCVVKEYECASSENFTRNDRRDYTQKEKSVREWKVNIRGKTKQLYKR